MADEHTDVSGNVTPSGTPTGGVATPEPSDRGDRGYQARIDGLVAEKERWKSQAEKLASDNAKIREASKSEAEKLMDVRAQAAVDEFKKSQYEPLATKAKRYEDHLRAENERMVKTMPADQVPPDYHGWEPEVQNSFLRAVTGSRPSSVGGVPNPQQPAPSRVIKGSDFKAWQSTNMYNPQAREQYEANKEDMKAAYHEGRIDWTK
jgi:hypothetical protein